MIFSSGPPKKKMSLSQQELVPAYRQELKKRATRADAEYLDRLERFLAAPANYPLDVRRDYFTCVCTAVKYPNVHDWPRVDMVKRLLAVVASPDEEDSQLGVNALMDLARGLPNATYMVDNNNMVHVIKMNVQRCLAVGAGNEVFSFDLMQHLCGHPGLQAALLRQGAKEFLVDYLAPPVSNEFAVTCMVTCVSSLCTLLASQKGLADEMADAELLQKLIHNCMFSKEILEESQQRLDEGEQVSDAQLIVQASLKLLRVICERSSKAVGVFTMQEGLAAVSNVHAVLGIMDGPEGNSRKLLHLVGDWEGL